MPREPEPSWWDGIRSLRADEFDQLAHLFDNVFWSGLIERYPHMYVPENAGNLRVQVVDGQVVAHIGTLRRAASLFGCAVQVASLGGVATLEAHRGKGYATTLLEDNIRFCRSDGVDFIIVSGYRKMYHRAGCRYVGRNWNYSLKPDQAGDLHDPGLEIAEAREEDLPCLAALYRQEPVRWFRPPSDYANALTGYIMNRPAHVLTVRERGALRGYVILQQARDRDEGRVQVLEYAGDRKSVVGILGKLVRDHDLAAMDLHVMGWDSLMQDLLEKRGLAGSPTTASGTILLVNFTQLMDRMRPYFTERVGEVEAQSLVFQQRGDEFLFCYGGDRVVASDRGTATQLIFGTPNRSEEPLLASGGRAGEILREIFPIPALWYGLNYV